MSTRRIPAISAAALAAASFALLAGCAAPTPLPAADPLESVDGKTYAGYTAPEAAAGFTGSSCTLTERADLPYATTDALIPGATPVGNVDSATTRVHTLAADAPLYAVTDDAYERIGTLPAVMPWETTAAPVVVVETDDDCSMSRVMIPARAELPSVAAEPAMQVTAWVPTEQLVGEGRTPRVVEISMSDATVTVADLTVSDATFGRADEATPTGLTYVLSQYEDAEFQPWTAGAEIVLTGAHSTATDSFGGNSAEIGIHFSSLDNTTGSAGCVRIPDVAAMQQLAASIEPGDLIEITH